jgi:hypothetical protein
MLQEGAKQRGHTGCHLLLPCQSGIKYQPCDSSAIRERWRQMPTPQY